MFENSTIKEVKTDLGLLCKTLRNRENLTQEQLAEQLALSRLTIQKLESGKNPTLDTVLKVLQHLHQLEILHDFLKKQIDDNGQPSLY